MKKIIIFTLAICLGSSFLAHPISAESMKSESYQLELGIFGIDSDDKATASSVIQTPSIIPLSQPEGKLEISSIIQRTVIDSFWEIHPRVFLKNTGDASITTGGTLTIIDLFGNTLFSQQLPSSDILPEAIEEITKDQRFNYNPLFLIGRYTVTLELEGDAQKEEKNVYAFPFILFLMIVIGFLVFKLYKKRLAK